MIDLCVSIAGSADQPSGKRCVFLNGLDLSNRSVICLPSSINKSEKKATINLLSDGDDICELSSLLTTKVDSSFP